MKITQFGHGVCSALIGDPCDCSVEYDRPCALTEETAPGSTDSARFSGGRRETLLLVAHGSRSARPWLRSARWRSSENTIVESNSILQFWKPDLYIAALDVGVTDFKGFRYTTSTAPTAWLFRATASTGKPFPAAMGIEAALHEAGLAEFVDRHLSKRAAWLSTEQVPLYPCESVAIRG